MTGSFARKAIPSIAVTLGLLGGGLVAAAPANADPWFSCTSWRSGNSTATGQCTVVTPGHAIKWRVNAQCNLGRSTSSWVISTSGTSQVTTNCGLWNYALSSRIDSIILY
jgi:hypothetical protein